MGVGGIQWNTKAICRCPVLPQLHTSWNLNMGLPLHLHNSQATGSCTFTIISGNCTHTTITSPACPSLPSILLPPIPTILQCRHSWKLSSFSTGPHQLEAAHPPQPKSRQQGKAVVTQVQLPGPNADVGKPRATDSPPKPPSPHWIRIKLFQPTAS